jgi:hypothetical protein
MLGASMSLDLAQAEKQGPAGKHGVSRRRGGYLCCAIALMATGCATPPVVKRDYLYEAAWRGSSLTVVGRQMVVDAAAGAAPQTVTLIDVNQRAKVPGDPERRARILDWRIRNVWAELRRNGIARADIGLWTGAGPEGVQTFPPGELQTKPMVLIAHY